MTRKLFFFNLSTNLRQRSEKLMQMAHEQFSIQIPRHPSLSFSLIFKSAQILYHDLLEVHHIVMSFQEWSVQRDAFRVPFTLHCSWKSFLSGGRKML